MNFSELKLLAEQTSVATVTDTLSPKAYQPTIPGLQSTKPGKQMFGQAVTMRSLPAREDCIKHTKKEFKEKSPNGDPLFYAMSLCGPGKVLVIDASGYGDIAIGGDMKFGYFNAIEAEGLVTDGSIRDQAEFRDIFDFPAFVKGFTPVSGTGRVLFGHDVNVDINCGGALVRPGDYILGDEDGVVVIPEKQVEEVLNKAVGKEKFAVFFRERTEKEKITYGEILKSPDSKSEFVSEFLQSVDLTDAQKVTFQ